MYLVERHFELSDWQQLLTFPSLVEVFTWINLIFDLLNFDFNLLSKVLKIVSQRQQDGRSSTSHN